MIYYLNIHHGDHHIRDEEDSDLPDIEAARQEAIVAARELMADAVLRGEDISHGIFEILNERLQVVTEVPFVEAIRRQA